MKKLHFCLLTLFASSVVYISCQKNTLTPNGIGLGKGEQQMIKNLSAKALPVTAAVVAPTGDYVVDSMIRKYNLVKLTYSLPPGFQARTISTIAEGSSFFDNAKYQTRGRTQTGTATRTLAATAGQPIVNISPTITPYVIEDNDLQHITIIIQFGNWSQMRISFDYTGTGTSYTVSNVNATVSGFTVGIGYLYQSSRQVSNTSGGISFNVNGQFSAGISGGGVMWGFQTPYYYGVTYNPGNSSFSVTEGPGTK